LVISIDRTEWDFGKTQINVLCAVASIGKMAVPLYFEMLDNNSGNSGYPERISFFKSLLLKVGSERIEILLMDREFVGVNWLSWLKEEGIPFCVRIPKNHKITLPDGSRIYAEEFLCNRKNRLISHAVVDGVMVNVSLSYGADGKLLFLIGSVGVASLKYWYRKRWTIEVFFQALKSRGFDMEKSCLRSIEKYRKLFAIACIAYTICWAVGIEDGRKNPVRTKKHGYPQYSVFRRGLNLFRQFIKGKIIEPIQRTFDKAQDRLNLILKTIG
jgi:hypothetical protein